MVKTTMIRLPDNVSVEVEKKAKERGIAFATMCRVIIVDGLKKEDADIHRMREISKQLNESDDFKKLKNIGWL